MKILKLVTGGLVVFIIGLFIWQNIPTFTTELPFRFNLYIKEHLAWTFKVYTLLVAIGLLGFILGIVVMLRPYFNVRRSLVKERQEHLMHPPLETEAKPAAAEQGPAAATEAPAANPD